MNMTILQENILNDTTGRNSGDTKGSLLRMSDADQTHAPDYTDGEDFDMDLNM